MRTNCFFDFSGKFEGLETKDKGTGNCECQTSSSGLTKAVASGLLAAARADHVCRMPISNALVYRRIGYRLQSTNDFLAITACTMEWWRERDCGRTFSERAHVFASFSRLGRHRSITRDEFYPFANNTLCQLTIGVQPTGNEPGVLVAHVLQSGGARRAPRLKALQ